MVLCLVCDEIINETPRAACSIYIGGVITNGKISCFALFHQFFWRSVKIPPPDIWAGKLVQICLYLVKSYEGVIFITMFGIACLYVDGIAPI